MRGDATRYGTRLLSLALPIHWTCVAGGRNHLASVGDVVSGSATISNVTNPTTWRTSSAKGAVTGDVVDGSNRLSNVGGSWAVGDHIAGTGIPLGASVTTVSALFVWMDERATITNTGVTLTSPGDIIRGTGIPDDTTVSRSGSTITLRDATDTANVNATATNVGTPLSDAKWGAAAQVV